MGEGRSDGRAGALCDMMRDGDNALFGGHREYRRRRGGVPGEQTPHYVRWVEMAGRAAGIPPGTVPTKDAEAGREEANVER